MIKLLASYNEKVAEVVFENAQKNAQLPWKMPPKMQSIVLLQSKRRFCIFSPTKAGVQFMRKLTMTFFKKIIVNEAQDESKREQMTLFQDLLIKKDLYMCTFLIISILQVVCFNFGN